MTSEPPTDPHSSRRRDLGFDEAIAVFVALAAIGIILFWGLTRREQDSVLIGSPFLTPGELAPGNGLSVEPESTPEEAPLIPLPVPETSRSAPPQGTTLVPGGQFRDGD